MNRKINFFRVDEITQGKYLEGEVSLSLDQEEYNPRRNWNKMVQDARNAGKQEDLYVNKVMRFSRLTMSNAVESFSKYE